MSLAFRLVIPLVLLVILGGAGAFSGLMPERSPADQYAPYGQAQHRPGDLRLREIADMAADAVRSVFQASLALLNGMLEPEPRREPDGPHRSRRGEPHGAPPDLSDDPRQGEPRHGW